jgi:DNA-binding transcriptional MocR family regulator
MFLWARIAGVDASVLLRAAIEQKMIFVPGTSFFASEPDVSTLRLSFATPTPDQLDEAVQRLARALERV